MKKGREKALHLTPEVWALSPPAFHIIPNSLQSSWMFWIIVRMSPAPHTIQPTQTEPHSAPPSSALRLLWSRDIPLLALYTAYSTRFWGWGGYFLSEDYLSDFSLARHHSLLWKWKMCHIITQRFNELTVKCYKQDRWMKLCMETLPLEPPFILWRDFLGKGKANEFFFLANCQD